MREDICQEALRLTGLLAAHPVGNQTQTHALLALMFLNAARSATRVNEAGHLLRLQDQDRSQWNAPMIARGLFHLAQSARGEKMTEYHLQAAIAACHCTAKDYASTDWRKILSLYDCLLAFDGSPVIALNRAVAVANVNGPQAGVKAVESMPDREKLDSYYLVYAVLGEFECRLNDPLAAAGYFRKSLLLTDNTRERQFLTERFHECEMQMSA